MSALPRRRNTLFEFSYRVVPKLFGASHVFLSISFSLEPYCSDDRRTAISVLLYRRPRSSFRARSTIFLHTYGLCTTIAVFLCGFFQFNRPFHDQSSLAKEPDLYDSSAILTHSSTTIYFPKFLRRSSMSVFLRIIPHVEHRSLFWRRSIVFHDRTRHNVPDVRFPRCRVFRPSSKCSQISYLLFTLSLFSRYSPDYCPGCLAF